MRISDWSSDVCSSDLPAMIERQFVGHADQPLCAQRARFDQHHRLGGAQNGDDQPREARTRTQIEPRPGCFTWNKSQQLCAVGDVALPYRSLGWTRNEILPPVFLDQPNCKSVEPVHSLAPSPSRDIAPRAEIGRAHV